MSEPTEALAHTCNILVGELREQAPEALPEKMKVGLLFPAQIDGAWKLVPRGAVERIPERQNQRPTRFSTLRSGLEAGSLLDSFILGEEAFQRARDTDVFDALLAYCEEANPSAAATRALADEISLAILLRAGIVVTKHDLPLPEHLLDARAAS